MNRIILIGNGFDRAHELPTSYEQFIADFWDTVILDSRNSYQSYEDNYQTIKISENNTLLSDMIGEHCKRSRLGIMRAINEYNELYNIKPIKKQFVFNNKFLDRISSHLDEQKWVDIENDYYSELKGTTTNLLYSKRQTYEDALKLNKELAIIECLLKEYLNKIESRTKIEKDITYEIANNIYSLFSFDDISNGYCQIIVEQLHSTIKSLFRTRSGNEDDETFVKRLKKNYPNLEENDTADIYKILGDWQFKSTYKEQIAFIKNTSKKNELLFRKIFSPDKTLLLDFNYTNTTACYKENRADTKIIHIHGELNNLKNPMIFGYGDEIGEDYQKIENLEENELLKNIKSIRYLDTNNYQKLMEFIETDYYQVFVMGHSCGNSDRTLLNTLFEHENCLSIKPYYYQYEEKEEDNNYSDIVRNISRNFRDKPSMRNKVVNKTYCEPLLKFKKSNT